MFEIKLLALETPPEPETRLLAHVEVTLADQVYDWRVYIPPSVTDRDAYLIQKLPEIVAEIQALESHWEQIKDTPLPDNLDPFQTNTGPQFPRREDVIKPQIPDYYALRRDSYPSLGEQLDAIWKGVNHPDWQRIQTLIQEVKARYPKPSSVK